MAEISDEIHVVCWNPECPTHCKSKDFDATIGHTNPNIMGTYFEYPRYFPTPIKKDTIPDRYQKQKIFVTCPFCQKVNVLYKDHLVVGQSQYKIFGKPTSDAFELKLYGQFLELSKIADETVDSHAKYLITLFLGIIGAYSALLSYFILFNENLPPQTPITILYLTLIPPIFLIASVIFNLLILCPENIGTSNRNRFDLLWTNFQNIIKKRLLLVRLGNISFIIGMIALIGVLGAGIWITQSESSQLVKLVVVSDNSDLFENMGIETSSEGGVIFTESIEMVSVKDQSYLVRNRDGNLTEFDKELVKGIVYL